MGSISKQHVRQESADLLSRTAGAGQSEGNMLTLYSAPLTGNSYKVRLLLAMLDRIYRTVDVDILKHENRKPEILALNPLGKLPILVLPDGRLLTESNAMLSFLGEDTTFVPADNFLRAQVLQWMFFEQYSHAPYIAVARYWIHLLNRKSEKAAEIETWQERGKLALAIMDKHLSRQEFLVGGAPTIADIALYAYTHVAADGEFDLHPYRSVTDWLRRVERLPGYVALEPARS